VTEPKDQPKPKPQTLDEEWDEKLRKYRESNPAQPWREWRPIA